MEKVGGETYGVQLERWGITQQEKRGSIAGQEGERRVREINCPRLCPRPIVCLHQSSAKRRRQDRAGGGGSEEEDSVKGDERGRRMKSRGQRFVMEVQNFRG